ncbi:hypothetical protein [Streptomyces chartreusis]|uniref:hypothetical protein n=1 Tax=Streptomyces chartreusis TaxID=1969 RepID=UPI003640F4B9
MAKNTKAPSARTRMVGWTLCTALAVGGLYAASPTAANEHRTPTATHQQHTTVHDARTVFRGVFFGHGPVGDALARHFPGLPAATPQITAEENRVMNRLEKAHPGTIRDFHAAVASGSHVRTKQAITSTSRTLVDTLWAHGRQVDTGDPSGKCLALYLAVVMIQWGYVAMQLWEIQDYYTARDTDRVLRIDDLVHDLVRHTAPR